MTTISWLLASCVEIVDLDTEGAANQLVIYGQLNNSLSHDQHIRVSETVNDFSRPVPVDDAMVTVEMEDGTSFDYSYSEDVEHYLPDVSFVGIPGQCYRLRVTTDQQTYLSSFQELPAYNAQDEVAFEFFLEESISAGVDFQEWRMDVTVNSQIPEAAGELFLKRDLFRVYLQQEVFLPTSNFPFFTPKNCWVEELVVGRKVRLFNGEEITTQQVFDQFVGSLPLDDDFNALRGFGVLQTSFSKEAWQYWDKVDQVSNREGSLFEVPPAPIHGNMSNVDNEDDFALGFFEVAKVDTVGQQITIEDVPIFLPLNGDIVDCTNVSFFQLRSVPLNCFQCLEDLGLARACYQCLVIPNSQVPKPNYLD